MPRRTTDVPTPEDLHGLDLELAQETDSGRVAMVDDRPHRLVTTLRAPAVVLDLWDDLTRPAHDRVRLVVTARPGVTRPALSPFTDWDKALAVAFNTTPALTASQRLETALYYSRRRNTYVA